MPRPKLSAVIAGAWRMADWQLSVDERLRWVEGMLGLGLTSFDHADIYGDYRVETLFGEALAASPGLRERMQIVSKCGIKLKSGARPGHAIKHYDTGHAHVLASVDNTLRALRTDRIDLLLIHRPDLLLDAEQLANTFESLRAAGKVLHFGVSNFTPNQFALLHARLPLATNQVELSPLHLAALDDGTLDQAQALGLPPMIWSPLAGGRLFHAQDERAMRVRQVIGDLAARLGISVTTLAFAWVMRHPSRPLPIIGSRRVEAAAEAVAALKLRLDVQDWYRVWQASAGREVA